MSARTRMLVIVGAAAALAAGGTVALAVITSSDEGGKPKTETPLAGAPLPSSTSASGSIPRPGRSGGRAAPRGRAPRPRQADLRALRLARGEGRRCDRRVVGLGLATVERLAEERPRNSLVLLHLGFANLWAGKADEAAAAWRRAEQAQPDSASAQRADTALHPDFPSGQPFFVPSFRPPPAEAPRAAGPARGARAKRPEQRCPREAPLRARSPAARPPDLGPASVRRRRQAPRDAEAQVAAAVGRFDKSRPSEAFSRLGPLTRRFPQAATVRFHLGLLLLWLAKNQPGSVDEAKRQLRLARQEVPGSRLAREAKRLLAGLEGV